MATDVQAVIIKTVQGVGYLSTFILSLVITIPMSMNQDQFKGRCLLFSTGTWQEMDGQFIVDWASQAYCNFTIFVAGKKKCSTQMSKNSDLKQNCFVLTFFIP